MLSNELAELAGVTVRTLRHYHQIGLLPEPPRSSAGYRHYDVDHLVRLLRITRLTALGIPLSALQTVLDDQAAAEELLRELDRQAAAEIERLSARRASIAALRSSGAPIDLPPELSALRSAAAGIPADMARHEHEQLLLLAHLLGRDGPARLAEVLDGAQKEIDGLEPLMARFYALGSETSENEVVSLIEDMVAQLAPVRDRLAGLGVLDPRGSALVEEFGRRSFKPAQQRVLRHVGERLEHPEED